MRRHLLCTLLVALAACAGSPEEGRDLALTCQSTACECAPTGISLFGDAKPGPVLWRENGDAYCAEGQALRRADYKTDFLKKRGG